MDLVSRSGRVLGLALAMALASEGSGAGPLRERLRARQASSLPPGATVERDVPYGTFPRQRMDVYLPAGKRTGAVIVMVHGGAWRIGDKSMAQVIENKVARWVPRGHVFVSINYRMLPQADPLAQADDVARALAAVQARAASWGADPRRVILMGHSAGAHLVALLSARPERAAAQGATAWLGTVVLDSAALDVESVMENPHEPLYDAAFGTDRTYWRSACPEHQLAAGARPMFLVCSSQRKDDPCAAARRFADTAARVATRPSVLPRDLSHREVNETLGLPGPYTDAVEAFMASLLR